LRYDGGLPFSGLPPASSFQSLLAAIETIRAEPQITVALGEQK